MSLNKNLLFFAVAAMAWASCGRHAATVTKTALSTTPDSDTVSIATATRYVSNYADFNHDSLLNTDGKKQQNTRCIWFSARRLRHLLDSVTSQKGDGIRFYMAAYDPAYKGTDSLAPKRIYWRHNTLVMVSTRLDTASGNHVDYYNGVAQQSGPKGFIVVSAPENRGELCPPPANCNSIGATLIPAGQ
ncbi:hypothetical protein SAMN05216490_4054 [Mucilaginibacter mallensis]|uniref:Uncharacterized protein n=1 Tax=Mucilaginibacter mallensis TaxID=652787 RepID=A0A1H2BD30_MUCMA|nr:hypothetical protein [Mucilaginibacter mallensis]SDT56210.1 hypothetical protein SAMN05216490_4054 [Mucilaginibacter mallensis]